MHFLHQFFSAADMLLAINPRDPAFHRIGENKRDSPASQKLKQKKLSRTVPLSASGVGVEGK
jgi:hypothetical protein